MCCVKCELVVGHAREFAELTLVAVWWHAARSARLRNVNFRLIKLCNFGHSIVGQNLGFFLPRPKVATFHSKSADRATRRVCTIAAAVLSLSTPLSRCHDGRYGHEPCRRRARTAGNVRDQNPQSSLGVALFAVGVCSALHVYGLGQACSRCTPCMCTFHFHLALATCHRVLRTCVALPSVSCA
jgi:hypothetical protein